MLAAGARLGPYEVTGPLGAGGMGEVWRARDTRLGRDVAIKVLPHHLSAAPELRARFEREARTISSLNHPNICVLHDVGREGDTDYLVMELVDGETLADRISRGPLPLADVCRIGGQIADALERAHRAGVVHRDLKPGNVMLTKTGAKLMDFGLARADAVGHEPGDLTQSPTLTRPLTAEGHIVGTFQYMAPEQMEGRETDARADVWALGCVLYEMATGRRAFEGRTQASLIGSIMHAEPAPISAHAPLTPPAFEHLVRQCLAKDPDERIQTAHDVRLQLAWIAQGGSQAGVAAPVVAPRRAGALPWIVAGAAAVVALALGAALLLRPDPPARVLRFRIAAPPGTTRLAWPRLSPDGTRIAFLASDSAGSTSIWVQRLDALVAQMLPGTENAGRPFWSPDSRQLGFTMAGKVARISIDGGPVIPIGDAPGAVDGAWGRDLIALDGGPIDSIRGMPVSGGALRPLSRLDHAAPEFQCGWPTFLPDGRHFLYMAFGRGPDGAIRLGGPDGRLGKLVGRATGRVEYAPPGYLVFLRDDVLMAQRFDLRGGRLTGEAVPIADRVPEGAGAGYFSVSPAGMIAYQQNTSANAGRLVWFDRTGRELGEEGPPLRYRDLALSPDGTRLAMSVMDPQAGSEDLWIRDLVRHVSSRQTFERANESLPVWSPDGGRIAYASDAGQQVRVYLLTLGGEAGADTLPRVPVIEVPRAWAPDGRTLVTERLTAEGGWDLYARPLDGSEARVVVHTAFGDRRGALSPDGRWLAYVSTESGRTEVYLQGFPTGRKIQISTQGATMPVWRPDGRELFIRGNDLSIQSVSIETSPVFQIGTPQTLFRAPLMEDGFGGTRYAATRDGRRFLLNVPVGGAAPGGFVVVTHWDRELKGR